MDKQINCTSKEDGKFEAFVDVRKKHWFMEDPASNNSVSRLKERVQTSYDNDINAIIQEEDYLIAAHWKEIKDTMDLVLEIQESSVVIASDSKTKKEK